MLPLQLTRLASGAGGELLFTEACGRHDMAARCQQRHMAMGIAIALTGVHIPCSTPELADGTCPPSLARLVTLTARWHGSRPDQHDAGMA